MRKLRESIFTVGAIDWDARLFDRLIPLPDGTSYNSYLIRGSEKTALLESEGVTIEGNKIKDFKKILYKFY